MPSVITVGCGLGVVFQQLLDIVKRGTLLFRVVTSDKFCYRQQTQLGFREATLDRSTYEYSDLTDAEILEREKRIAGEIAKETAKELKRMAKARKFHFRGGML